MPLFVDLSPKIRFDRDVNGLTQFRKHPPQLRGLSLVCACIPFFPLLLEASWDPDQPPPVTLPWVTRTSHDDGSVHSSNLPLNLFILNSATSRVPASSVEILVDGTKAAVAPSILETPAGLDVTLPLNLSRSTAHTYRVQFSDGGTPGSVKTFSAAFRTDVRGTGDFVVEAEDFDYDGGRAKNAASQRGYRGLAYDGVGAVAEVDFQTVTTPDTFADNYRSGERPNVPLIAGTDLERSGYEMDGSWMLSAVSGSWFQYTRTLPSGDYEVYAAMSQGIPEAPLTARLHQVVWSAPQVAQTTLLGEFRGTGSGAWGENSLIPLTATGGGAPLVIQGGSTHTFRWEILSGAADYLVFVPSGQLKFTRIQKVQSSVRLEWVGEGLLMQSSDLLGVYVVVPGGDKSPVLLPVEAGDRYFRLVAPSSAPVD